MTICDSIEEKEQIQSTGYLKTYNTSATQRQIGYEHGLLYSSYPCQLNMDERASPVMIYHKLNSRFKDNNYISDQTTVDQQQQQQQQQGTSNYANNASSLFCNNPLSYNTATVPSIRSSNSISFNSNSKLLVQQHQYESKTKLSATQRSHGSLIENNKNEPSSTNKDQSFEIKRVIFHDQYHYSNTTNTRFATPYTDKKYQDLSSTKLSGISKNTLPLIVESNTQDLPKRYGCTLCGKNFVRPSSLTTHTYSHTGEKPFQCPVERCGRRFSVISNLRRHGKVHSSSKKKNLPPNSPRNKSMRL